MLHLVNIFIPVNLFLKQALRRRHPETFVQKKIAVIFSKINYSIAEILSQESRLSVRIKLLQRILHFYEEICLEIISIKCDRPLVLYCVVHLQKIYFKNSCISIKQICFYSNLFLCSLFLSLDNFQTNALIWFCSLKEFFAW